MLRFFPGEDLSRKDESGASCPTGSDSGANAFSQEGRGNRELPKNERGAGRDEGEVEPPQEAPPEVGGPLPFPVDPAPIIGRKGGQGMDAAGCLQRQPYIPKGLGPLPSG